MNKLAKMSFAFAVGISSLVGIPNVKAESNEANDRIGDQLERIELQISKMDNEINLLQNEKTILKGQINKVQKAIFDNEKKLKETEEQIITLEKEIQNLQIEIDKFKEQVVLNKLTLSETLNGSPYSRVPFESSHSLSVSEMKKQFLVNADKLSRLLIKEGKLQEKINHINSLKIELIGISELLKEQINEKTILVEELDRKEESNKNKKEHLLQESKTLIKQKSAIEKAIELEKARMEGKSLDLQHYSSSYFGDIDIIPGQVPQQFMKYYLYAEQKYGVPWYYLAAIHGIETSFSTNPTMVSSVGAVGHMQFMPSTWVGSRYETTGGLVSADLDITNLDIIKNGGGYGVDADNDGIASPWSIADSVAAAAKYLSNNGFSNDIRKAIWHYNHADWYVNKVIAHAEMYKKNTIVRANGEIHLVAGIENTVTTIGNRWINNSVYVFGGGRNQNDIKQGRFDCSSFVHWVFAQVGISLGELTSVSTDTLKNLGTPVNEREIQPGDLVFFDTYKKDGHVGIYLGEGKFIGAQSSTGVAIEDMSKGYWKEKFNGRINRIIN
ncbi:hypothetical protein C0966_17505 (plasmid) [Bacillus methanolicus]|uniref:NlpC/P60 family protein n=1 Tax=Bacillus methanolicus TaxID=1471 RepID=UPI0023802527|nr:NlpC/P60 family protein [Bacillus methanolicus]MDE3841061.1 hypothetical protein [Bacillus methanolicus]